MRRLAHHRSGFTLVEMLLVLGLIAVFVGMTLPSVLRIYGQQKLTAFAERVREAIANTRKLSIETGLEYQFCCEVNGTHFVVVPFEQDHMISQGGGGQSAPTIRAGRHAGVLPSGLSFGSVMMGIAGVPIAGSGSHQISSMSLDGLPNAGDLAGLAWAPPILFNPDGSAGFDTELVVRNNKSQFIKLRVRAFTGAVSMDRISLEKRS